LGLTYYISDTPGTGGTLKKEPEDFVVEEIPIRTPNQQGSYMICRVTMKNWEQQHAVKRLQTALEPAIVVSDGQAPKTSGRSLPSISLSIR